MSSREVKFYGYSDDLLEVEDPTGKLTDEYDYDWDEGFGLIRIKDSDGNRAVIRYIHGGDSEREWSIRVEQDGDNPIPESWNIQNTYDEETSDYSDLVILTLPKSAKIKQI